MAHERIYVDEPAGDATSPGSTTSDRPWGVYVQWLPDGDLVGIGTGRLDEPSDSLAGPGRRNDMMMVWVRRSDVNRVIRVLRRARNSACGADE